jgi:hypothetical protein
MLPKQRLLHALKALAAIAVACVVVGISPAPASAGEYTVPFCGQSSTGSTASWTHSSTTGGSPYFWWSSSHCGPYAGYVYRRFEIWTVAAGASDDWTFDAPAGTYVSRLDMYQDARPRSAGAGNAISAWQQDGSRTTVAAATRGEVLGDTSHSFPLSGSKVVKLRASLFCQSGGDCPGLAPDGSYGNENYWGGAVVHLVDPSLPVFETVGGEGWKPAPSDGRDAVDYSVTDTGAGVKDVRFYLDGVLQATTVAGCTAEALTPCPRSSTGSFTVDTTRLSEGQHDLKLIVADGSSNEETKVQTITVRRPPQPADPSAGGNPVSTSNPSWSGSGAPAVGDQLRGGQGSWVGTGLSFAYQWMRCDADGHNCVAIPGATAVSYTAGAADVGHALQFCVTATNSGGSDTRCSTPTAAVVASHPSSASTADRPGEVTTPAPPASSNLAPPSTPAPPSTSPTPSVGAGAVAVADRGHANGAPAADQVVLSAVTNNRTSTQKVKFGKRVPISGRLFGLDGAPISGAVLSVQVQTTIPGASIADAAQVATDRNGRFTYLAPAGPSRVIRFGYRSHSADTAFADTTDVRLLVAAGVTMKAKPAKVHNRHATVFTGRLLGKPIPARGVVVDLQVFFRKQWRTFAAPRTSRSGAYKFKYRFMAGAATWKFRARVRKETSYPFELGVSRKLVKVKVVP